MGTTLMGVEHLPERNEHETHSNQIITMDRFSDVRNGWPYDYHTTFWDNYYRKYGTQNYDYDFSIQMPFPNRTQGGVVPVEPRSFAFAGVPKLPQSICLGLQGLPKESHKGCDSLHGPGQGHA